MSETTPSERLGTETVAQSSQSSRGEEKDIVVQTGPLLWPTAALLGVIAVGVTILVIGIVSNPNLVGGPGVGEIIVNALLILGALLIVRFGIKLIVLNRTTYTIYDDGFQKEYSLFYRHYHRQLPLDELRGIELEKSRFETLFGCGTIRLLTGGTDRSLGFVEFESVRNPAEVHAAVETVRSRNRD